MSDDLTDDQIALLCEIGEHGLFEAIRDNGSDLQRLLSGGSERVNDFDTPGFEV